MENILVIQTVNDPLEVALWNEKSLSSKQWISAKDEVARVLPMVEELLREEKLNYEDLKGIAVVNGIGSFSATRIGVTIANSLAFALDIPLFEITVEKNTKIDLRKIMEKMDENKVKPVKIAQAVYDTEPMISPSKKQKFV
ncbi:MAG: tRNA (adenosine(37)-N6)-threonylcarbamoyltransferase complex dimerization subunit type 1 TsaB [Candidatus Altimarinota bacterium]